MKSPWGRKDIGTRLQQTVSVVTPSNTGLFYHFCFLIILLWDLIYANNTSISILEGFLVT